MKLSNKVYDVIKFTVIIVLPAVTTLVSTVGIIWQLPNTEAIVTTLVAVTTFLGALIGISSAEYKKG